MSILDALLPARDLRVLVTAGAGGVGAAIARAFHAAGARVHVCDIDRSALDRLRAEQPAITASMADVSLVADVQTVFDDVEAFLGGLDVLVGNAGIAGPRGPIETIDSVGWERAIAVNVHSQFHFARRAVPLLRRSRSAPSLIIAGAVAERSAELSAADASRTWAVVGLMRALAVELGPHGIRVNAILLASAGPDRPGADSARAAMADNAAAVALFLCSPAARTVTGQTVRLDGSIASR
ncbi:MAG TPA: SDR family oxidoreductase [Candidatus Margulisiibacteriota bacterium]|nr:SDR family oxidoreductase [Candidatus Margulisiibacteriota bacterium]